jgi:plastocyanin
MIMLKGRLRIAVARLMAGRALVVAVTLGGLTGMLLALGSTWAQDAKKAVTIDNFTFSPAELKIPLGTTVTWVNRDDIPHTVVDTEKKFRSKALDTDDSYSFTFTTAGTFDYFCSLHSKMVGKVIVGP